ncbi:MAG TPA: DUF262 domain-containing HNH endonuclease family protein [Thermoanaerobaculia bacterium]|jgi:uncharacterized protein with ParB-like and HNH nuclease domain|nr:DUF262 domain-containing HNH endonuclease family protein [Thermoanaerobaculia bacterium]
MDANAVTLLDLFEKKMRLEVPLFQRQYVWNQEQQWEPLWEDIVRKFTEYLEGRKDAPVHFLGAMVLDLKQTPATHVEKRQIIDGQQRLTTFQIFLAAFRDFCREYGCEDLAGELEGYTLNKGMMANPEIDKFKVWPTQADRGQFIDVLSLGSRIAIEKKHPVVRQKYARNPDPRPRMVEAYIFFSDEIYSFFIGTEQEPPLAAEQPIAMRIEECFQALKNALQVVAIDLGQGDDAQVIFETLNARGQALLPADLLRNYIFLRAARLKEPQEELYENYWRSFDDSFWRTEIRQGRLFRPRSDLFIQHFLASRLMVDIPVKHLFVEYRSWIDRDKPFKTVAAELAVLSKQGDDFRRLLDPRKDDYLHRLGTFLNDFDISTAYPLLLFFLDKGLSDGDWKIISTALESYLLRRAILGWTTKSYNKIFLNLIKAMQHAALTPQALIDSLSRLHGESAAWPNDEVFAEAWQTIPAYNVMNNAKLVHVFQRLGETYLTKRSEDVTINCPLTIEHILPASWAEHWPLPNGKRGLTPRELGDVDSENPEAIATRRRNSVVHTIGNLTVLTQNLNSVVSNSPWPTKKPELLKSSLLPINQQLHKYQAWNEETIEERGRELLRKAVIVWPTP